MGKHDAYMKGRNEGMDFALRIAEKDGIEALKKEIAFRGITGYSVNFSRKDLQEASQGMREHATATAIALSFEVLKKEFCFADFQLQSFIKAFNQLVMECLEDPEKIREYIDKTGSYGVNLNFTE